MCLLFQNYLHSSNSLRQEITHVMLVFLIAVFNFSIQQMDRLASSRGFQSVLDQRSIFSFADPSSFFRSGMCWVVLVALGWFQILDVEEMGVATGNGSQQLGNKFVTWCQWTGLRSWKTKLHVTRWKSRCLTILFHFFPFASAWYTAVQSYNAHSIWQLSRKHFIFKVWHGCSKFVSALNVTT